MDKITHKVRCEQQTAIINSGMPKTTWCKANDISDKQFFYWQRILRQEVDQEVELQSSSPTFVEIRPVTSDIESSTFQTRCDIRSGTLTVESVNTASEELLRKLWGIVHVE